MTAWEDAIKEYPKGSADKVYPRCERIDYLQALGINRLAFAVCRVADAIEKKGSVQGILKRNKVQEGEEQ